MKEIRNASRAALVFALLACAHPLFAEWYVQVAAFADATTLQESSDRLRKAGFPVETEPFAPKYGKPLTRLLVGPFATKAEAEAASGKLASAGWPGYLRFRKPPSAAPVPPAPAQQPPTTPAKAKPAPPPTPTPSPATPPASETFPADAPPKETRTPTPTPPPSEARAEASAEEAPAAESAAANEAAPKEAAEPAASDAARRAPPVRLRGFFLSEGARTLDEPRHWTKWRNTLEVNLSGTISEHVSWKLGGRGVYDAIYDLTSFYPDSVRRDQRLEGMFRETFVDFSLGDFDVRLGRQHIIWGEVVGLFFADVVSAKDLRDFVARDFDLIRIPQWAARLEWTRGDFHAEAIGIPYMTYDEIGVPGSEFYPYPLPPPPGYGLAILDEVRPGNTLRNGAYGLRLSYLAGGFDLSAFYYDSQDASPAFARQIESVPFPGSSPIVVYQPRHDRIHQAGMTVSKDLSPVVVKLEAVYTRDRLTPVTRLSQADGLVKQDTVDAVLSADYLPGDWRLNAQVFTHWFPSADPDLPVKDVETGVTLLVARKLFDGKLEPEALYIRSLEDQGWMLRAKLNWLILPALRFTVGADLFGGQAFGFFGRYDHNDRVAAEARYSF